MFSSELKKVGEQPMPKNKSRWYPTAKIVLVWGSHCSCRCKFLNDIVICADVLFFALVNRRGDRLGQSARYSLHLIETLCSLSNLISGRRLEWRLSGSINVFVGAVALEATVGTQVKVPGTMWSAPNISPASFKDVRLPRQRSSAVCHYYKYQFHDPNLIIGWAVRFFLGKSM